MTSEFRAHGIGEGTDAHLQAGPVGNELRTVASDLPVDFGGLDVVLGNQLGIIPDERVEALHGDEFAEGERNVRVHDREFQAGNFQGGDGTVHGSAEGNHPVDRFGHLDHRDVTRKCTAAVHGL